MSDTEASEESKSVFTPEEITHQIKGYQKGQLRTAAAKAYESETAAAEPEADLDTESEAYKAIDAARQAAAANGPTQNLLQYIATEVTKVKETHDLHLDFTRPYKKTLPEGQKNITFSWSMPKVSAATLFAGQKFAYLDGEGRVQGMFMVVSVEGDKFTAWPLQINNYARNTNIVNDEGAFDFAALETLFSPVDTGQPETFTFGEGDMAWLGTYDGKTVTPATGCAAYWHPEETKWTRENGISQYDMYAFPAPSQKYEKIEWNARAYIGPKDFPWYFAKEPKTSYQYVTAVRMPPKLHVATVTDALYLTHTLASAKDLAADTSTEYAKEYVQANDTNQIQGPELTSAIAHHMLSNVHGYDEEVDNPDLNPYDAIHYPETQQAYDKHDIGLLERASKNDSATIQKMYGKSKSDFVLKCREVLADVIKICNKTEFQWNKTFEDVLYEVRANILTEGITHVRATSGALNKLVGANERLPIYGDTLMPLDPTPIGLYDIVEKKHAARNARAFAEKAYELGYKDVPEGILEDMFNEMRNKFKKGAAASTSGEPESGSGEGGADESKQTGGHPAPMSGMGEARPETVTEAAAV